MVVCGLDHRVTAATRSECRYRKVFRFFKDAYQGMRMMYKSAFEAGVELAEKYDKEISDLKFELARVKAEVRCPHCHGKGHDPKYLTSPEVRVDHMCSWCKGTGKKYPEES
jgi:DnaJ-class molecular chaperone